MAKETERLQDAIEQALFKEREKGYGEGLKARLSDVLRLEEMRDKLEAKIKAWQPVVEAAIKMAEATDRHRVKGGVISEKNFVDYTCAADDIDKLVRKIPKEMRP